MKKLQIWWLKRRLRSAIRHWNENYAFYQCNDDLMDIITHGQFSRDKAHIESLKRRLQELK